MSRDTLQYGAGLYRHGTGVVDRTAILVFGFETVTFRNVLPIAQEVGRSIERRRAPGVQGGTATQLLAKDAKGYKIPDPSRPGTTNQRLLSRVGRRKAPTNALSHR